MALPAYATTGQKVGYYSFLTYCGFVFFFLIAPIFIILPLSFSASPFFEFTREFMNFEPDLGLSRPHMPFKAVLMAILISPMIVPLIITAAGMFFFYSKIGLTHTYLGLILAHTALGTPFVVITVTATLTGFDTNLIRASQSLGADTMRTFFKVIMPLILPGVISGGLFAFITSFDEVVIVMFIGSVEQITIPKQMWAGLRQETSPVILCMATCLVALSIALLTTVEMLRRRSERLRGIKQR